MNTTQNTQNNTNLYQLAEYFHVPANRTVKIAGSKVTSDSYLQWIEAQAQAKQAKLNTLFYGVIMNPERKYPVRIDPVVQANDGTAHEVSDRYVLTAGTAVSVESLPAAKPEPDTVPAPAPKVLSAPKGQRGKLRPQDANESFAAYQARLASALAERAEKARARRSKLKSAVLESAELAVSLHGHSKEDALTSAIAKLPERIGVATREEIMASLNTKFKGFSHTQNKVRGIGRWENGRYEPALRAEEYASLRMDRMTSKSDPLINIRTLDRSVRIPHTPNCEDGSRAVQGTQDERLESAEQRARKKDTSYTAYSSYTLGEMSAWIEALDRKANPEPYEAMESYMHTEARAKLLARSKVVAPTVEPTPRFVVWTPAAR